MQKQNVQIRDFSGGQNDRANKAAILDNQAELAQNVWLDDAGGVSCQEKSLLVSSLPAGVNGAGIWTYIMPDGTQFLIAANRAGVSSRFYYSQDGVTWTTVKYLSSDAGGTTDVIHNENFVPEGVSLRGQFYLTTGDIPNLHFDGIDWRNLGAPKLDAGIAGLLNGTYLYKITMTVSGEEIAGEPSFDFAVSNKKIELTKIPLGPANVTTKRTVYRTVAGGSVFKFVADINNNTTSSYSDNTADGALGADILSSLSSPPRGYYPVVHQERLFLFKTTGNPDLIAYSSNQTPHCFPRNNAFALSTESQVVWGGFSFKGELLIFCENDVYRTSGDGIFVPFTTSNIIRGIGCTFHRSVREYYNKGRQLLIFMSKNGFFAYDGSSNPERISDNIQNTFNNILQPNLVQGSKLFTTQADWESFLSETDIDTSFSPGSIQIEEQGDATLSANCVDPTYTGSTFQSATNTPNAVWVFSQSSPQAGWPLIDNKFGFRYNGLPVHVGSIQYTVAIQKRFVDHVFFRQSINLNGASASAIGFDYYFIDAIKEDGSKINIFTYSGVMSGIGFPVDGTPADIFMSFPKTNIVGFSVSFQVNNSGVTGFFSFVDIIHSFFKVNVKQYKPMATWVSPVIDTATASVKVWKDILSSFDLNGVHDVEYYIKSDTVSPPATSYVRVFPPQPLSLPPTDRYVQIKIVLALKPTNLNLPGIAGSTTYPANTVPEAPISGLNPYPLVIQGAGNAFRQVAPDGSLTVLHAGGGIGSPNSIQWTRDLQADNQFSPASGWAAEIKFKILPTGIPADQLSLFVFAEPNAPGVTIENNLITLWTSPTVSGTSAAVALSDGLYHVVRITGLLTAISVYLDDSETPLLTGTALGGSFGRKLTFGKRPIAAPGTPWDAYIDYVSWILGINLTNTVVDNTTTPIVHDAFISWAVPQGGILPVSTVSSVNFKNRYWCAVTEIRNPAEGFNNMVAQLDINGAWVFRRGEGGQQAGNTSAFMAAFSKFKERLYWISSTDLKVFVLEEKPAQIVSSSGTFPARDSSIWRSKKHNFGTENLKDFRRLLFRVRNIAPSGLGGLVRVRAIVDDTKIIDFLLTLTPTGDLTTVGNFPGDGRQVGVNLQLEINNNPQRPFTPIYSYELYEMVLSYTIFKESTVPSQAVVV